jgi:mannose-6-phosphate isomerase-like protein (cupin superfamily)
MTQYVFDSRQVNRYRFPTHTNDLIMDRSEAATSEAFFVILEAGETVPQHVHRDAEQVFFVLEGAAEMTVSPPEGEEERVPLGVGDFVRTPPGTLHTVANEGPGRFVYLSIDCFTAGPPAAEPTWDRHVQVMCAENGWDYEAVRLGRVTGDDHALSLRASDTTGTAS